MYKDTKSRSFIKAVVWKVIATFLTMGITYYYSGEFGHASKVGITTFILGLFVYYWYERLWNFVYWGKFRHGHWLENNPEEEK
jgi:uncharacterized membrane protein